MLKISKRTKISISVGLTLVAACAWESNWFSRLSVALGVSDMSVFRVGNAWARNLNSAPIPGNKTGTVRYLDPVKDWPTGRQLALMMVRRTEFVKPIAAALTRSTVIVQRHDWRWLLDNNFIERHDKTGYLVPTAKGGGLADTLAFHHAGETLRMHVFKPGQSGEWHSASVHCSCGFSCVVDRSGASLTQARIYAAQSRHLESVENGSFKPMGAILDQFFGKVKDG